MFRKHRKLPGWRVDRASGLNRKGDTRVLVANPSHLMASSHGPVPVYGSPPTPDSLVNKAALAGL
eukprot:3796268-Prymnesium_polylepis.1